MSSERTINGYTAADKNEYEAFLRDTKRINAIKNRFDLKNYSNVSKVYSAICNGSVKFESKIGFDFEDEITASYERMSKKQKTKDTSRKKPRSRDDEEFPDDDDNFHSNYLNYSKKVEDSDENVDKELVEYYIEKQRRSKSIIKFAVIASCFAVLTGSVIMIVLKARSDIASNSVSDELEQSMKDNAFVFTTIKQPEVNNKVNLDTYTVPDILNDYQDMYDKNNDLIGWIKIDDTNINYPVVQCEDNEYYLSHNFKGKNDANGCIFVDMNCHVYPRSKNLILYGHHMKSGKMFANLEKYDSYDFFVNHRTFKFDTIYEYGEYEVIFVFRDYVHASDDTEFKYYEFVDVNSETEFNSYMEELKNKSIYNSNVSVSMDDELLTLSTCDYMQADGRFVVMAKKIR